jgi:hypothetical protein
MPKPPGLTIALVPIQKLDTAILITPKLRRSRTERPTPPLAPWKKPRAR